MLAELYHIASSIDRFGISAPDVHAWVKPLNIGPLCIVSIDEVGVLRDVELRRSSEGSGLVKIQKDNQNAFPTFKLACPLYKIAADHPSRASLKQKDLAGAPRSGILAETIKRAALHTQVKNERRFAQLIRFAGELKTTFEPFLVENCALEKLFAVFAVLGSRDIDTERFLQAISRELLKNIAQGENVEIAERALIGAISKKGTIEEHELPLMFDVFMAPEEEFIRVAHAKTGGFYNRVLLSEAQGTPDGICGLAGDTQVLELGNLPSPRLPALSDTILFSVNPDIPCLERYGTIGSRAFPIGKQTAKRLNNAARWITSEDKKGKTWSLVPRNEDSGRDLIIAYVDVKPDLDADLAELFSQLDGSGREAVFEAKAKTAIEALDSLRGRLATGAVLHTLLLRRISKGQVQVEISRQFRVETIKEALLEWQTAVKNAPLVRLWMPTGKGKPAILIGPRPLFPGEIIETTKWMWIRGGRERQAIPGFPLNVVYDLYLGEGSLARSASKALVETLVSRSTPLLLFTGDQLTRSGRSVKELNPAARESAMKVITLLGIALYKLGRKKEVYMNETAFRIGRMLALSDVLHAQYCRVVRRGDLPPQLLGNQHYSMAADRPYRACAVLGERLRVYRAWADTAKVEGEPETQQAIRAAKWAVREMGTVALGLHENLPEGGLNDQGKAEMLFGYLAREKKESGDE